jgi:hypothetical protein
MLRRYINFAAVSAICLLTACSGEELVQVPYEGTPYGNERTAGFGVAYVRASMAPARGLNTADEDLGVRNLREIDEMAPAEEAVVITPPEPVIEKVVAVPPEEPVAEADEVFNKQQRK